MTCNPHLQLRHAQAAAAASGASGGQVSRFRLVDPQEKEKPTPFQEGHTAPRLTLLAKDHPPVACKDPASKQPIAPTPCLSFCVGFVWAVKPRTNLGQNAPRLSVGAQNLANDIVPRANHCSKLLEGNDAACTYQTRRRWSERTKAHHYNKLLRIRRSDGFIRFWYHLVVSVNAHFTRRRLHRRRSSSPQSRPARWRGP